MSEILINGYLAEIDRLRRVTGRSTDRSCGRRSRTCSRTGRRRAGCRSSRSWNTRRRSRARSIPTARCCTTSGCRWGCWEAKDTADDLDAEIGKKFAQGLAEGQHPVRGHGHGGAAAGRARRAALRVTDVEALDGWSACSSPASRPEYRRVPRGRRSSRSTCRRARGAARRDRRGVCANAGFRPRRDDSGARARRSTRRRARRTCGTADPGIRLRRSSRTCSPRPRFRREPSRAAAWREACARRAVPTRRPDSSRVGSTCGSEALRPTSYPAASRASFAQVRARIERRQSKARRSRPLQRNRGLARAQVRA